jgi:predicted N-formylglutamate amidohydrolase
VPLPEAQLLAADEPSAYLEVPSSGPSGFIVLADHAGARIPRKLANLGLPAEELTRHIAWDIGVLGVARRIAATLHAPLVAQNYSRLVIDCNRDPKVASSIPDISETREIPGNKDLSAADIAARRAEIFDPYHGRITEILDERAAAGQRTIVVAQHTMTDVYKGVRREMHAAILYNRDRRFAGIMLAMLRRETGLIVADNEPYFVSDETDYTIPHHAEARSLPYVEIEIRQDLVRDDAGQAEWAERIAGALKDAEREFAAAREW